MLESRRLRVLVGSVGSSTAIGVVQALRDSKIPVTIIGTDTNPRVRCAGACMVDSFHQVPPAEDRNNFSGALLEVLERENIQCAIPIHDAEIVVFTELAIRYPKATFWAVNSPAVVQVCNDKREANNLCRNLGIKVPRQLEPENLSVDLLPVIVKPITGVGSRGIAVLRSTDDLNAFFSSTIRSDIIIQDLIEDGTEYTVDCYCKYNSGSFVGGVVRERVETKAGVSTKGVVVDDAQLLEHSRRILEELEYKGASNLQFIRTPDTVYFIEINPRFSGAGCLSYRAGLDSPVFTILEAMGRDIPAPQSVVISYGVSMARYWSEMFYDEAGRCF